MTRLGSLQALVWTIALIVILAAAILAGQGMPAPAPRLAAPSPADPVLARCREAGEAALRDDDCRRAWNDARALFFGRAVEDRL